ncbi:metal-dependent hydrolase [Sphingomonas canadensis]|uniref:Metal-dependent hydrolase n=1 Tax=Sphingomonas canadensis TaxID=1219257 RepID=A0ABW3H2G4_9SPHN|nr:metal-dependent hydrolase [Sphingomonas canadensis]MCW3835867.1 metal-dependent hydrolase [Sphingomonas canadensis]
MAKAKTPADLSITPRDRRFGRGQAQERWWFAGDPVATAFMNALSITFPKGEAMFIESVKACRDGAPPKLEAEIRAFVQQEVMHSREHVAFNKRVVDAGYDLEPLERVVDEVLAIIRTRPPIVNLAATMALEHYTAILAQVILKDPDFFKGVDRDQAEMWTWHAIEEIEHKGVAYDTWIHATRDWSAWRRWKLRSLMMFLVTINFWKKRVDGAVELLRQDGITRGARRRVWWYLLARPGLLRRILVPWAAYFVPGFHPWKHDDRHLIGKAESDYAAAVSPAAA